MDAALTGTALPMLRSRFGVIFDWDGTLCDSDFLFDCAVVKALRLCGLHKSEELIKPHLFMPRQQPLRSVLRLPKGGREEVLQLIKKFYEEFENAAQPFDGIEQMLHNLWGSAVPMGVVTNRNRASFDRSIYRSRLSEFFSHVACGDETPVKPSPDGIIRVMSKLSVDTAVYVGNTYVDHDAARNAGCRFLAVGFCSRLRGPAFEVAPDKVLKSVAELELEIWNHLRRA